MLRIATHTPSLVQPLFPCPQLADDYWENRTVAFLGDSINNLVSIAFECEAAKAHSDWQYAGGPHPDVPVTVLNAGYALSRRLKALEDYNGALYLML